MKLDPFYLIVDSSSWLERLVPIGARFVQLRVKECSEKLVRAEVRAARAICANFGARLVINDFWRIALDESCDFVHLGQSDLDGADIAALRARGIRLGVSTHDEAELDRAISLAADYVALGPIYPTLLKQMSWKPQGLERIRAWKRRLGAVPLVAIGGLTPERAKLALDCGADSACVVTDVIRNADSETRTREWIGATDPWRTSRLSLNY